MTLLIDSWSKTQENGLVLYEKYPMLNLATDGRSEVSKFAKFCDFKGIVLDVGSGLQVPYYLRNNSCIELGVGIDPLVKKSSDLDNVKLVKAIGEKMPFRDEIFDCISFATSFDHVIDPYSVLKETYRMLKKDGIAIFWVEAEYSRKTPFYKKIVRKLIKKTVSEDVANAIRNQAIIASSLEHPKNSIDKFHLRHIKHIEFISLASSVGFKKIKEEYHSDFDSVFLKFEK